jgi:5-methylcytosine-specific restriction endonuclease McrA
MDQRRATRLARAEQQIDRERKERLSIARARRQLRTEGGLAKSGFQVHKRYGNMHWIDWNKLVLDNNGRCYYCGRKRRRLVKEHRIPLARGGTNDESNIVPACTPCNSRKGTLTDTEFIEVLQRAGIRKRGN